MSGAWPLGPETIAPFFIAVLLIELTPGPNMGYLAALAAGSGRAAGFRCVAGVTLGLAVYMLGAVAGLTQVVAEAPVLYALLHWAGVAFLFYLAWEAWRGAGDVSRPADQGAAPFWRGFIANVLNPKAALFYVTLLPGFITPDHAPFWAQALTLGAIHLGVSIVIHSAIVLAAGEAGVLLARLGGAARLQRASAIGIALVALWLAVRF